MNSGSSYKILGSSSSGNCGLITTNQSNILIDAGFSGKKICEILDHHNFNIKDIHAVFLTHEHSDHSQGFRGLCKHEHLTWICNRDTFESINHPKKNRAKWSIFETGSKFLFRDLEVETFSIPHDAADPVGYLFSWGGDDLFSPHQSLAWVLDLGYVTNLVKEKIVMAKNLVIEANYDPQLLEEDTKRPWSVKQRIQSRHGHLSNKATFDFLSEEKLGRIQNVALAHLSKDCNSVPAIRRQFIPLLNNKRNLTISVFNPETATLEEL